MLMVLVVATAIWIGVTVTSQYGEPSTLFSLVKGQFLLAQEMYAQNPSLTAIGFALAIFAASVIGLPPPGLISILAGAVLGFSVAFMISLPMAAFGAAVPFVLSRKLVGPWLEKRFARRTHEMREGLRVDGPLYLFSLRLVPLVPFPLVNLFMGVTLIRLRVFVAVSMLGRLPLTALYCNAGVQLSTLDDTGDILQPAVVISLAALAIFPHLAKIIVRAGSTD